MNFTNIKSPNRMNTNRNIPYNVKDIDWPGLKAVGISKEQLEADGNLDLLLQGKESEIIPLKLCTPVISLTMDATLKLVPGDNNRTIMEINGIRQEESPKKYQKNKISLTCPCTAQSGTGHQKEKEYDRNSD